MTTPKTTNPYTQDSDAADKEWLYEEFFRPGWEMDEYYEDDEDEDTEEE